MIDRVTSDPHLLMAEQAPDAIFIATGQQFVYLNPAAITLFGADDDSSLLGTSVLDRVPEYNRKQAQQAFEQILRSGSPLPVEETTYLTLQGELINVEASTVPYHYKAQQSVLVFLRDIHKRKATETALKRSEERFRQIFERNEAVMLLIAPATGEIVDANDAASRFYGYSVEQLRKLKIHDINTLSPEAVAEERARALKQECNYFIFPHRLANGEVRQVEVHSTPIREHGTNLLFSIIHDITARQSAEQALQQLNQNLEQKVAERTKELKAIAAELREALSLNETILQTSSIGIAVYRQDGRCILNNQSLSEITGYPREALLQQNFWEFPYWQTSKIIESAIQVLETGKHQELEVSTEHEANKQWMHYKLSRMEAKATSHLLLMAQDITTQKLAEEDLKLTASVFHSSAEGVIITDARGTILSVNPAFSEITGYSEEEALGETPSLLRSDRHPAEFYDQMWQQLACEGSWQNEIWNRRKDGEAYLEWLTINRIEDSDGETVRYVAVFHDITELRQKDEHIHHLAFHDALTGLPNRTLFQDRLQHALERAKREQGRLSVTFVDLDRFKSINDTLGHDIGDLLLQEVGKRIKNQVRAMDTVARLGGDEFVVLMEDLHKAGDCANLADTIIKDIARPMTLNGHHVEIGASMGMAFFPEDGESTLEMMKRADMAMYEAKSAGRNTYRFFQAEMLERTSYRLHLEMELRNAISHCDLTLHYQPKVNLISGTAEGAEALIRWQHPERGLIPPVEFIPLAEECGLIGEIGDWVLEEACRQIAAWLAVGRNVSVAVNLSAHQFDGQHLVNKIQALIDKHQIPAANLEIELTESVMMSKPEHVADLLGQLRQLGVTIAIDDFGTGYSSLAYLRQLPIDTLKIDRSFVMDADRNEEDAQIVRTILALGHSLNLNVVAEGIESKQQAELLRSLGCQLAQGYFFAKPLTVADFDSWWSQHP